MIEEIKVKIDNSGIVPTCYVKKCGKLKTLILEIPATFCEEYNIKSGISTNIYKYIDKNDIYLIYKFNNKLNV